MVQSDYGSGVRFDGGRGTRRHIREEVIEFPLRGKIQRASRCWRDGVTDERIASIWDPAGSSKSKHIRLRRDVFLGKAVENAPSGNRVAKSSREIS